MSSMVKNRTTIIPVFFLAIFFLVNHAASQSVFIKDGSIIEGDIVKENDLFLVIKENNRSRQIQRTDIIRIVYNDEYKNKVNIILMDGRIIKGHVVEEGKDFYMVRKDLTATRELKVDKGKINGIMKKGVSGVNTDTGDSANQVSDGSSEFPGLSVKTEKNVYNAFETIVVIYNNMPGGRHDWISLARVEAPDNYYDLYLYTNRRVDGELVFKEGLPPGDYEVRVYLHWSKGLYTVSKRYKFKVIK